VNSQRAKYLQWTGVIVQYSPDGQSGPLVDPL